jgi:protein ImuB
LHAQSFTSCVSIEPPNALLLEVKGSLRLFESVGHLHGLLDARWQSLAITTHSAIAPSTLAALWCARAGFSACIDEPTLLASRLASLPIVCTAWDAERLRSLRSMGITRLGELLRLPRAGLALRLGVAAVRDLDIATGREAEPRRAFVARQRFRERMDFEAEIENVAYLERACEPVLGRCARFLRERQAGVQALQLRLRHRDGPATLVRLGLAGITGEQRRLADVLGERLARLELPAPVRALELVSGRLQPLSPASLDVFGACGRGAGPDTAQRLVERLRARLGESAVYGVAAIPDHRPEAAWRRVQELPLDPDRSHVTNAAVTTTTTTAAAVPGDPMPRPLWLFDMPVLLADAKSPQRQGWVLEHGPERIESGWWDGKGVARDYYCVREGHGGRLWIFQERRTKRWYLHGVFA